MEAESKNGKFRRGFVIRRQIVVWMCILASVVVRTDRPTWIVIPATIPRPINSGQGIELIIRFPYCVKHLGSKCTIHLSTTLICDSRKTPLPQFGWSTLLRAPAINQASSHHAYLFWGFCCM